MGLIRQAQKLDGSLNSNPIQEFIMKLNTTLSPKILLPLALAALSAAAILLLNRAHAYPNSGGFGYVTRQTCYQPGSAGDRGRQMGLRNGNRLVSSVWQRLGQTCDRLDHLARIISETPLARPYMGGEFAACFYLGYTDALFGGLESAYDRCQIRCFSEGTAIGRISAEGYCSASIAVGGLYDPGFIRQPGLPFCGQNLVMGCKSQYVQTATFDIPACFAYTSGAFEQTFENSVRQDCFVPSDVPIRDRGYGYSSVSSESSSRVASAPLW